MINWFRKLKIFHKHQWTLVATNKEFYTEYSGTSEKKYWEIRFYNCRCGERHFTSDQVGRHQGINQVKRNWFDAGVVPKNSFHPTQSPYYVKIGEEERKALDPILAYQQTLDDIQKSLKVIINRDFQLEEKYPELKKAADEYHRRLDKYRNFEKMKE